MSGTTSSSPEMMLVNCTDMTVQERQQARSKWQHLLHHHQEEEMAAADGGGLLGEVVASRSWKPNMVRKGEAAAAATWQVVVPVEEMVPGVGVGVGVGRESSKKRKANDKVVGEEDSKDKRSKGGWGEDGESKITGKSSRKDSKNNALKKENSADETSKDNNNSKVTEVQKLDYIHVRARRGQATDNHSLAERVRREKISARMKYLQDLVPGCNGITGKAGMLDEIINYVQSLQRQVEFLSMKLAAVDPRIDISLDSLYPKEGFPSSSTEFPAIGMSPEMTNAAYLQLNSLQQQIVACCGLDIGINTADLGLRRTTSPPVSVPQAFIDSTCFNRLHPTAECDADLQNMYNVAFDQGRSTSFPTQPVFTGQIDAGNLKMEL